MQQHNSLFAFSAYIWERPYHCSDQPGTTSANELLVVTHQMLIGLIRKKFLRWFFFFFFGLSHRKTPSMPAYSTVRLLRCGSEGRVWIRWWMPQHSDVLFWWMQESLLRACLVHERRSRLRSVLFCLQINTRCFTITQRKKKKKCTEIMRSGFHLSVEK